MRTVFIVFKICFSATAMSFECVGWMQLLKEKEGDGILCPLQEGYFWIPLLCRSMAVLSMLLS